MEKISLSALVASLAVKSGCTAAESESFVKGFFNVISESLEAGEAVKVPGLGTFKLVPIENRKSVNITDGSDITIPGHNRIVFVATREVAEKINKPFAIFNSVELESGIDESILNELNVEKGEREIEEYENNIPTNNIDEDIKEDSQEIVGSKDVTSDTDYIEEPVDSLADSVCQKNSSGRWKFLVGFACGLLLALVVSLFLYSYFLSDDASILGNLISKRENKILIENGESHLPDSVIPSSNIQEIKSDTGMPEVDTQPSQIIVYDTIGAHRYLTTMAQDHYGNFNLWPYIYEENKAFLGHPDRIKPGTRVVIPSLQKYNVDAQNPDDIKEAKKLGYEIYRRYSE